MLQELEVDSGVHGDGADTGAEEEPLQGGEDNAKDPSQDGKKKEKKKKEGPPKGRWMVPKTQQGHIDLLIEDGKLRPDSRWRLPSVNHIPPQPESDEQVVFKAHSIGALASRNRRSC